MQNCCCAFRVPLEEARGCPLSSWLYGLSMPSFATWGALAVLTRFTSAVPNPTRELDGRALVNRAANRSVRKMDEPWYGHCEAQPFPPSPKERAAERTLVLGGMQTPADVVAALGIVGLTRLMLYNNAASRACDGTDAVQGDQCGQSCAAILAAANASIPRNVTVACVDRPNRGRGEAGFFQYVSEHYDDLAGIVVFSQSTLTNDENRLSYIAPLVTDAVPDGPPTCSDDAGPGDFTRGFDTTTTMCKGELLDEAHNWTLTQNNMSDSDDPCDPNQYLASGKHDPFAGLCIPQYACKPNPDPKDTCEVLCSEAIRLTAGTTNVGRSTPGTMAAWLHEHAPGPKATLAPVCYGGFVRTTATALRRRPRRHYANILRELSKCANPEASHYVERAMLYLFASI